MILEQFSSARIKRIANLLSCILRMSDPKLEFWYLMFARKFILSNIDCLYCLEKILSHKELCC